MKIEFLLLLTLLLMVSCVQKKLTPATELAYEGELIGNDDFTYASSAKVIEKCMAVKSCMGLMQSDYPLPRIRGMRAGNAVECGVNEDGIPKLKLGCYTTDDYITVPEGADLEILSHECVHHWLYQSTGDVDPDHSSSYFLLCSGGLSLDGDY
jgi:hypothetical protein